ncbi:hypothetical protein chiPu_0030260, partial [Chiloscyllium punctatum]|nr:hypothetical protein [Chiloscyllium punctatum]
MPSSSPSRWDRRTKSRAPCRWSHAQAAWARPELRAPSAHGATGRPALLHGNTPQRLYPEDPSHHRRAPARGGSAHSGQQIHTWRRAP